MIPAENRLAVISDAPDTLAPVTESLRRDGREIERLPLSGPFAAGLAGSPPAIVLLHLSRWDDCRSLCLIVREVFDGPLLVLGHRYSEADHVACLDAGADDYLHAEGSLRLLCARVNAVERRSARAAAAAATSPENRRPIELGALVVDPGNRSARLHDRPVNLTASEFDLLMSLARRPGVVVSRRDLYAEVMGCDYEGGERAIDLRITRLRRKLGDDGRHPRFIKSIRGRGYLLVRHLFQA